LTDIEWQNPTVCEGWSVKDVAQHILADDLSYLSRHRDKEGITFVTESWDELISLINQQNETWVQATRRLSRKMLLSLLKFSGDQFADYIQTVPLYDGTHPVSWAGKQNAPMWLQVARELTEYWMHHQHICEAVGRDSLKNRKFLLPVLSTFMYALPRTYSEIKAPIDSVVKVHITGEADNTWVLIQQENQWSLYADTPLPPTGLVTLTGDTAWRLFTKGISSQEAQAKSTVAGDIELGNVCFSTVAILA
jgi:uncharacterized protein (TIGR03083 family)